MPIINFAIVVFITVCGSHGLATQQFGFRGNHGMDGRSGTDGYSGRQVSILVTGQQEHIDTSGTDGQRGEYGQSGGDASNCFQRRPSDNEQGADGGIGGQGGRGGHGGNAGDITLFAPDYSQLEMIHIQATGGRGGEPGRGSYGGIGCRCQFRSWQRNGQTFYCYDGRNGREGRNGAWGRHGRDGSVKLIARSQALEPTSPEITVSIQDLTLSPTTISKNQWQRKQGILNLLAPGSAVRNDYLEWQVRLEARASINWQAERPIEEFGSMNAYVSFSNLQAKIEYPENLWLRSYENQNGPETVETIDVAIKRSEVESLDFESAFGTGRQLSVTLVDASGYPDLLETHFQLVYYVRVGLSYLRAWSGTVPSDLIERTDDRYTINVGNLPLWDRQRREGRDIKIVLTSERRFENKSTAFVRELLHTIGQ